MEGACSWWVEGVSLTQAAKVMRVTNTCFLLDTEVYRSSFPNELYGNALKRSQILCYILN